jgi:hypothetical protein
MPMIDIYATAGTFSDTRKLAADAAAVVKGVENVPDIPMFRQKCGAKGIYRLFRHCQV